MTQNTPANGVLKLLALAHAEVVQFIGAGDDLLGGFRLCCDAGLRLQQQLLCGNLNCRRRAVLDLHRRPETGENQCTTMLAPGVLPGRQQGRNHHPVETGTCMGNPRRLGVRDRSRTASTCFAARLDMAQKFWARFAMPPVKLPSVNGLVFPSLPLCLWRLAHQSLVRTV